MLLTYQFAPIWAMLVSIVTFLVLRHNDPVDLNEYKEKAHGIPPVACCSAIAIPLVVLFVYNAALRMGPQPTLHVLLHMISQWAHALLKLSVKLWVLATGCCPGTVRVYIILSVLGVSCRVTYNREPPEGFDDNPMCRECLKFDAFKTNPSRYPGGSPSDSAGEHECLHEHRLAQGLLGLPPMKDKTELSALLQGFANTSDYNERLVVPHFAYTEGGASYYKARSDPITGESRTKAQRQALIDEHPNVVHVETPASGHLSCLPGPLNEVRGRGEFFIYFTLKVFQHALHPLHLLHPLHRKLHPLHPLHRKLYPLHPLHRKLHPLHRKLHPLHLLHRKLHPLHPLHRKLHPLHLLHRKLYPLHRKLYPLHRKLYPLHPLHRKLHPLHPLHRKLHPLHPLHRKLHPLHRKLHPLHPLHRKLHPLHRKLHPLHLLHRKLHPLHLLHPLHRKLHPLHRKLYPLHRKLHPLHPLHRKLHPLHLLHRKLHPLHLLHPLHRKLHPLHPLHPLHRKLHLLHRKLYPLHRKLHPLHPLHPLHRKLHPLHPLHRKLYPLHRKLHPLHLLHPLHRKLHPLHPLHRKLHPLHPLHPLHRKLHPLHPLHRKLHPLHLLHPLHRKLHPLHRKLHLLHPLLPMLPGRCSHEREALRVEVMLLNRGCLRVAFRALEPQYFMRLVRHTRWHAHRPGSSSLAELMPKALLAVGDVDSEAGEGRLFEALRPSLSTRVEAAVRQSRAERPLKASSKAQQPQAEKREPRALCGDTEPHTDSSELEGAASGDWGWAKREGRLQPLPASISCSIDRHEIPAELGGDEGSRVAESTTSGSTASDFSRGEASTAPEDSAPPSSALAGELEAATVERLPGEVWCGAEAEGCEKGATPPPRPPIADNSDVCLVVSTSFTPQLYAITVQLREPPSSPMACVQAVAGALDAVEVHCDAAVAARAAGRADARVKAAPDITVTWCTLPHCPFFASTQSPAELPLSQRVSYVAAKEAVMKRFHHLVARFGSLVRFAAAASSGSVLDFGAEVFFACPVRRLLSLRAAACDSGDKTAAAAESSSSPVATVSVGFPLSRVGIFPSTTTVASLQRLCGSVHTVKWVPVLHTYDVSSLADIGLLSIPDAVGDATDKSKAKQWWLLLEQLILEHVCQSPAQRRWAVEMLMWSRGFHDAAVRHKAVGAMSADIADGWYTYAMGALSRNPSSTEGGAARGDAESTTGRSLWMNKMQALTATEESAGAAVLLDCSDKAVMDTLDLVETHLAGTAAQRARLPYLNVVLIGDATTAQPILQRLPCAAVISSASAFCEMGHASVQQVRLYASPKWPTDLQQDTLLAALTYLKRRGAPHVVAAGAAPQRLLLALCQEAVLVARSLPDAMAVESAAKDQLGLCLGPFRLMDAYGTVAVASMAAAERTRTAAASDVAARAAVAPVHELESCMRSMAREGLLGARGARGGFYDSAVATNEAVSAAPLLREAVLNAYVRHTTLAQVGDRLRAAVLNVACELLTRGEVQRVDDVDLLSMSALGWREETGGVLYQVDQLGVDGLPRLVEHMTCLATTGIAPHLAPHPLLLRMVTEKVRFASLKASGLL
ncbi:putative integral membrane protein [Leishmania donovani]|uniref:Putative integral membrane protein n=1 Tax=Leishmania donovani TaxID=5661 RepID=A0A504XHF0_LEIDO|nr:putative integral membrane protein [Leishmania donovani]